MKTFSELIIGDVVYKVWTNYESKDKPRWEKIPVHNIVRKKLKNKDGNEEDSFCVNEYYSSYGGYSHLVALPFDKANIVSVVSTEGWITTDYNEVCEILKKVGLKHISDYEKQIESYKQAIINVRKAYYEYLNFTVKHPIETLID